MRRSNQVLAGVLLILMLIVGLGCGSDKGSGPVTPQNTPAELVGTWHWYKGWLDGVQVGSFEEISYTDTSTSQELDFYDGGTWETREYYEDKGVVYTRKGTCYDDDSLYLTCTNENGTPHTGECQGYAWEVENLPPEHGAEAAVPPPPMMWLRKTLVVPGDTVLAEMLYMQLDN